MVKMKGLALPIETIVIVAVAVLVLVVIAAFFASGTGGGDISIRRQQALEAGCQNLRSLYNCDFNKIDDVKIRYAEIGEAQPKADGHTLSEICGKLNLGSSGSDSACMIRCGCSTDAVTTTVRR